MLCKEASKFYNWFHLYLLHNNSQEKTNVRLAKQDHQNLPLCLSSQGLQWISSPSSAASSTATQQVSPLPNEMKSKEWKGINVLFFLTSAFSVKKISSLWYSVPMLPGLAASDFGEMNHLGKLLNNYVNLDTYKNWNL